MASSFPGAPNWDWENAQTRVLVRDRHSLPPSVIQRNLIDLAATGGSGSGGGTDTIAATKTNSVVHGSHESVVEGVNGGGASANSSVITVVHVGHPNANTDTNTGINGANDSGHAINGTTNNTAAQDGNGEASIPRGAALHRSNAIVGYGHSRSRSTALRYPRLSADSYFSQSDFKMRIGRRYNNARGSPRPPRMSESELYGDLDEGSVEQIEDVRDADVDADAHAQLVGGVDDDAQLLDHVEVDSTSSLSIAGSSSGSDADGEEEEEEEEEVEVEPLRWRASEMLSRGAQYVEVNVTERELEMATGGEPVPDTLLRRLSTAAGFGRRQPKIRTASYYYEASPPKRTFTKRMSDSAKGFSREIKRKAEAMWPRKDSQQSIEIFAAADAPGSPATRDQCCSDSSERLGQMVKSYQHLCMQQVANLPQERDMRLNWRGAPLPDSVNFVVPSANSDWCSNIFACLEYAVAHANDGGEFQKSNLKDRLKDLITWWDQYRADRRWQTPALPSTVFLEAKFPVATPERNRSPSTSSDKCYAQSTVEVDTQSNVAIFDENVFDDAPRGRSRRRRGSMPEELQGSFGLAPGERWEDSDMPTMEALYGNW